MGRPRKVQDIARAPHPDAAYIADCMEAAGAGTPTELARRIGIRPSTLTKKISGSDPSRLSRRVAKRLDELCRVYSSHMENVRFVPIAGGESQLKNFGERLKLDRNCDYTLCPATDDGFTNIAIRPDLSWTNTLFDRPYLEIIAVGDTRLYSGSYYYLALVAGSPPPRPGATLVMRRYRENPARFEGEPGRGLETIWPDDVRRIFGRLRSIVIDY